MHLRRALACLILAPLLTRAADAPPATSAGSSFSATREQLKDLQKSDLPEGSPQLRLDPKLLGSPVPTVTAPSTQTPTRRTTAPKSDAADRPSSGWLLDALAASEAEAAGTNDDPGAAAAANGSDREDGKTSGTATSDTTGIAGVEVANPLTDYMASWLTADDYLRLRSVAPEIADSRASAFLPTGSGTGGAAIPDSSFLPVSDASDSGLATPAAALRPEDNPFLQSSLGSDPTAPPPSPVTAAPSVSLAAPEPPPASNASTATTSPILPAPHQEDQKYFPQLRRF